MEARCESACLGLLFDMFEAVDFGADLARNRQNVTAEVQTGTARVAEELMVVLGDQDGDQLREWLLLWRSDSKAFAERMCLCQEPGGWMLPSLLTARGLGIRQEKRLHAPLQLHTMLGVRVHFQLHFPLNELIHARDMATFHESCYAMPARPYWSGFLKLSLVTVPVKAYSAASTGAEIHLNQLHDACNSRIQYKKTCPIHGEVKGDQIVSGYEYEKGRYVVIDTDELDKLRTEGDKSTMIDAFVPRGTIDPVYFNGKSYYLLPDAPVGQRPFQVICQGMAEEKVWAVAQVVLHGREQLILLRPVDNLLAMTGLSYDAKVNKVASFEGEAPPMQLSEEERELTGELIRASMPKRLDLAKYRDVYTEKLTALVEAKVQGREIVAAPAGVEPKVINLMDALKKSVAEAQKASEETAKPPKKMAASARGNAARKKKTS